MSNLKTWRTKEEVLRDLAEATGRRVQDLDEEHLVVGERPPPKRVIEDDDEMSLLFDGLINRRHVEGDSSPDLDGITEMLRMVNDYDGEEGTENSLVNPADTIITISKLTKLDPNVNEFVPKCAIESSSSSNTLECDKNCTSKTDEINTGKINIKNNIDVTVPKVNDVESDKFKVLTEKLKKQISDSSKSDSLENKRQKNVAIATLLKLYSTKAPTSATQNKTSDPALKLMTPEDFQGNVCKPKENALTTEHPSPSLLNSLSLGSEKSKCNNTATSTVNKTPVPNLALNPEIKASIDKVNKWFGEPTKNISPTVFSSPVSFKRKETKASKSPVTNGHKKITTNSTEHYKPSSYASDLSKQYVERNKAKSHKRNMWLDLEDILKEKDLAIKQRLENESSNNQGTNAD